MIKPEYKKELKYDKELQIAVASSRNAKQWKNKSVYISEFIQKLSNTTRTNETHQEFVSMGKGDQDNIKDVGAFVGASCKGGRRRKQDIQNRHIMTFDVDHGIKKTLDKIQNKFADVCYTVYSTHKHTKDTPRFRLLIYPDRPMLPDEYQAVMRKLAETIDIDAMDESTYDINRLMYWPSTPIDGEYLFYHNDAEFLKVQKILESYGDNEAWKNVLLWPTSSRETKKIQSKFEKQADPLTKRSIVGAFCRCVNIHDALKNHIPGVYNQEKDDRYTYVGGSSTNGLVVYDNKFCYSNHESDPAHGQTCNSFDIVRTHKYGKLDEDVKNDTPIHKMPSYLAMSEYARGIKAVKIEMINIGIEISPEDFDSFEEKEDDSWKDGLKITENGVIKPVLFNAHLIIANDPEIKNKIRENLFSTHVENKVTGKTWRDIDSVDVRLYIGEKYNVEFADKKIEDALIKQANINAYHPVRDYLTSLNWDGKERIETIFIDYMDVEDTPYIRQIAKCWFAAAVYRVMEPGTKFDTSIVLSGAQGIGKTSFLQILAKKKWYGELTSFDPKIAVEEITGKWLIEINEMGATNKQALEQQKSFLSACHTRVRPAYARHAVDYERQCVFMGSTNQNEYLKDSTGNRRWWPVDCYDKKINLEKLTEEVDQIWAEAFMLYCMSASIILTDDIIDLAKKEQEDKREKDPQEGIIIEFLETPAPVDRYDSAQGSFSDYITEERTRVCVIEIWQDCLNKPGTPDRRESFQIGRILSTVSGWKNAKKSQRFGCRFGVQKEWVKIIPD